MPDPIDNKRKRKNKAIVISESPKGDDGTFNKLYEKNKKGYNKFYPEGVENFNIYGQHQLDSAINRARELDADIIFQGHSGDKIAGVPLVGRKGVPGRKDRKGFSDSLIDAQNKGYDGSCFFGSCEFENEIDKMSNAGVNLRMVTTPEGKKWHGPNRNNIGSDNFESYFFGLDRSGELLAPDAVNEGSSALDEKTQYYNIPGKVTRNASPIRTTTPFGTSVRKSPNGLQSTAPNFKCGGKLKLGCGGKIKIKDSVDKNQKVINIANQF